MLGSNAHTLMGLSGAGDVTTTTAAAAATAQPPTIANIARTPQIYRCPLDDCLRTEASWQIHSALYVRSTAPRNRLAEGQRQALHRSGQGGFGIGGHLV